MPEQKKQIRHAPEIEIRYVKLTARERRELRTAAARNAKRIGVSQTAWQRWRQAGNPLGNDILMAVDPDGMRRRIGEHQ